MINLWILFCLLFNVQIQEYIELGDPKSSAELHQLLLKYESHHSLDHGEMCDPRLRSYGNNSFRYEGVEQEIHNVFQSSSIKNHMGVMSLMLVIEVMELIKILILMPI